MDAGWMQFFLFFFSPSSPLPSPPPSERTRGTASSRQAEKEKRRREKEGLWRRDKGLSVSVCHLIHRPLLRPAVPSVICCHTQKKNFPRQTHTSKTLRRTHKLALPASFHTFTPSTRQHFSRLSRQRGQKKKGPFHTFSHAGLHTEARSHRLFTHVCTPLQSRRCRCGPSSSDWFWPAAYFFFFPRKWKKTNGTQTESLPARGDPKISEWDQA